MSDERKPKTLTVGELVQELQGFDPDLPVMSAYPSGDYWGRVLASTIDIQEIGEGMVQWTDYHRGWQVTDCEEDYDDDGNVVDPVDGYEGKVRVLLFQ